MRNFVLAFLCVSEIATHSFEKLGGVLLTTSTVHIHTQLSLDSVTQITNHVTHELSSFTNHLESQLHFGDKSSLSHVVASWHRRIAAVKQRYQHSLSSLSSGTREKRGIFGVRKEIKFFLLLCNKAEIKLDAISI